MLTFFKQFQGVVAMLSEKQDGSMKIFPEDRERNRKNRERFFIKQGILPEKVVGAQLVHGERAVIVSDVAQTIISETDALVTKEKNIFLSVTVADCLPLFLYDPVAEIIGIVHAGWKGIVGGIVASTLEKMLGSGATKENIHVACGPSIQTCHFVIQSDVASHFVPYKQYIIEKGGEIHADLQGIVVEQLEQCGIQKTNIETSSLCTFCEKERFFSYRRDKPEEIEAMVAVIGIKG